MMEDEQVENSDVGDLNIESSDEFAFETDHLALRGNKDYCNLLKYIVKLEAQRIAALKDIEELADAKKKALDDPLTFIEDLKSGKTTFPPRQTISDLPDIDWHSYGIDASLKDEEVIDGKPKDNTDILIRGRKFTDSKPETFNQLWSCEEQKRLEELLLIYPEQAVGRQRFKKIAEALGTRTEIQVACRVQKYFAKLVKAGLPIPGRTPKGASKSSIYRSNMYKKSTFFPQLHVPVTMDDPYDIDDIMETRSSNKLIVELLKSAKEQRLLDEKCPVYQSNTICVGCNKTGFRGARWTDNAGTDYCTDCVVKLLPAEKLMPVRQVM